METTLTQKVITVTTTLQTQLKQCVKHLKYYNTRSK